MAPTIDTPESRIIHARDLPPERPFYSEELLANRVAADRRRAAAMVLDHDTVAGMTLRAITPRSYSMLCVIGSPFLAGAPGGVADVRNYVWLHSPDFTVDPRRADGARAKVMAELERNILPPWLRWRYSRRRVHDLTAAGYAIASAKIGEIFEETFADGPAPGNGGPRVGASLEAQFLEIFAQWPRWPLETPVSFTPLRKLYQLLRCANGGDFDSREADIIAEELARDNAPAIAARKNQET
jgi:hypothetical protein